jgi:hypothetical protein
MPSSAVIDIAIGLILVYLVLSLICTIANETIANLVSLRAKTLRSGVEDLIDDKDLRKCFADHGLIVSAKVTSGRNGPSYLSGRSVALALLDSLNTGKSVPTVEDFVSAIQKLPESNVKDALATAAAETKGDIHKLRAGVAAWFDDSMDRLSGIYKRRLHWISFAVGLFLAVLLNADTAVISKSLWADSAIRGQAVEMANTIVKTQANPNKTTLAELEQDLRPMPLGWDPAPGRLDAGWYKSWFGIFEKSIGWLMTALAITLGAPFWFDLLGKFMSLRTSGAKPPSDDARKDAQLSG